MPCAKCEQHCCYRCGEKIQTSNPRAERTRLANLGRQRVPTTWINSNSSDSVLPRWINTLSKKQIDLRLLLFTDAGPLRKS
ncbi:hypothetical protein BV22DRAFT_152890 [Leucogyrophana mollusca]|uniref:Uncharacterized protein n=1 Tax=Leucogyrophana mollusca TaxID=85980 RepID=A0ACB8BUD8_9AGAM|nr:hypothetical protein BV22DRAFT_152890 [Leucogyrophana mollusca]